MEEMGSHFCNYKVDLPYPPVQVEGVNSAYACEMLNNMADVVSEMSAIAQYFYISVVAKERYKDIAECFSKISEVEMHHLEYFAEFARLLGADPRLWSCKGSMRYWSPSFVPYPRGIRALVAESIKAEEAAISTYTSQTKRIQDKYIVEMIERIILDEERHLQVFKEIYQNL